MNSKVLVKELNEKSCNLEKFLDDSYYQYEKNRLTKGNLKIPVALSNWLVKIVEDITNQVEKLDNFYQESYVYEHGWGAVGLHFGVEEVRYSGVNTETILKNTKYHDELVQIIYITSGKIRGIFYNKLAKGISDVGSTVNENNCDFKKIHEDILAVAINIYNECKEVAVNIVTELLISIHQNGTDTRLDRMLYSARDYAVDGAMTDYKETIKYLNDLSKSIEKFENDEIENGSIYYEISKNVKEIKEMAKNVLNNEAGNSDIEQLRNFHQILKLRIDSTEVILSTIQYSKTINMQYTNESGELNNFQTKLNDDTNFRNLKNEIINQYNNKLNILEETSVDRIMKNKKQLKSLKKNYKISLKIAKKNNYDDPLEIYKNLDSDEQTNYKNCLSSKKFDEYIKYCVISINKKTQKEKEELEQEKQNEIKKCEIKHDEDCKELELQIENQKRKVEYIKMFLKSLIEYSDNLIDFLDKINEYIESFELINEELASPDSVASIIKLYEQRRVSNMENALNIIYQGSNIDSDIEKNKNLKDTILCTITLYKNNSNELHDIAKAL